MPKPIDATTIQHLHQMLRHHCEKGTEFESKEQDIRYEILSSIYYYYYTEAIAVSKRRWWKPMPQVMSTHPFSISQLRVSLKQESRKRFIQCGHTLRAMDVRRPGQGVVFPTPTHHRLGCGLIL